ncbi:MAG: sensor histidine kinase [Bacteroidetes bacterium]|nr:sensor histidine kinase [Bacteroidota bacterium]
MKLRVHYIVIFCCFLLLVSCSQGKDNPSEKQVSAGLLDLRGDTLSVGSILQLNGQWSFCFNKFLGSRGFDSLAHPVYVKVPGEWNKYLSKNKHLPDTGYASYRLKILLPRHSNHLALHIPVIGTAYTLLLNDTVITQCGVTGTTKKATTPGIKVALVEFTPQKDTVSLVFHVSNFHYCKAGLWYPITMGPRDLVIRQLEKHMIGEYILVGACFFLFLYLVTFFISRPKEKAALYFSLFLLICGIRTTVTGEITLLNLFPGSGWELINKIDLLSFYWLIPVFIMYFRSLFPYEVSRFVLRLNLTIISLLSFITVFTRGIFYSIFVPYAELYCLVIAFYFFYIIILSIIRNRDNAWVFLCGYIFLLLATVNEILFYNDITQAWLTLPVGVLGMFFSQTILFSRKFSREFHQIETLSGELKWANSNIEKANRALNQLDKAKGEFLHMISNDIRKPLNRILGYTGILKSRLQSANLSGIIEYLDISAKRLEKFSKVAMMITELQDRQIAPQKNPVILTELVDSALLKLKPKIEEKNIRIRLSMNQAEAGVTGDPALLMICCESILDNAIKYSHPDGDVTVRTEAGNGKVTLLFTDSGSGFSDKALQNLFKLFSLGEEHIDRHVGLDLALVKLIIDAHGAAIDAGNNKNGPGACIKLIFSEPAGPNQVNE